MKKDLHTIDDEIDKQLQSLTALIEQANSPLVFKEVVQFKLHEAKTALEKLKEFKCPGVYFFEIKTNDPSQSFSQWLEKFKEKWEADIGIKNSPNLIKYRTEKYQGQPLSPWLPMYIGISKNVYDRVVHEHIFMEKNKKTFAMKLYARENLWEQTFRLQVIKLEIKNYNCIAPKVESAMIDKYNILIGKK